MLGVPENNGRCFRGKCWKGTNTVRVKEWVRRNLKTVHWFWRTSIKTNRRPSMITKSCTKTLHVPWSKQNHIVWCIGDIFLPLLKYHYYSPLFVCWFRGLWSLMECSTHASSPKYICLNEIKLHGPYMCICVCVCVRAYDLPWNVHLKMKNLLKMDTIQVGKWNLHYCISHKTLNNHNLSSLIQ